MSEAIVLREKEISPSKTVRPSILKVLIILLSIFCVAELSFYCIIVPMTTEIQLKIIGSKNIGNDELSALAGITGHEKWIHFNTSVVATRLASCSLFESVVVQKKFPDTVEISVIERTAVAIGFGKIKGRTVPVEIDKNGVAFRIGHLRSGTNIPLITGLTFENPVPGMRLNQKLKPLLEQIAQLEQTHPVLLSAVSEIKIEEKTYGGYDLVIYPVHTQVRVRTDKALNQDALQYMMLVLDVVRDMSLGIDEIDIRAGTVAYRVKGETL